jgi:hypothetical protein
MPFITLLIPSIKEAKPLVNLIKKSSSNKDEYKLSAAALARLLAPSQDSA